MIVVSAYDDPALMTEARRAGAYDYLVKGGPVAEIVDAIGRADAGRL